LGDSEKNDENKKDMKDFLSNLKDSTIPNMKKEIIEKYKKTKENLNENLSELQGNSNTGSKTPKPHNPSIGFIGVLKRVSGLFLKETKILITDKIAMLIAFALPATVIILLVTLGGSKVASYASQSGTGEYIGRGDPPNLPPIIGFIDDDQSNLSKEFKNLLLDYENTGYCQVKISDNRTELEYMLGKHQVNVILVIPPLFEYNLTIHFPTILTVVFDTIDTMALQDSQGVIDTLIEEFKQIHGFTGVFNTKYIEEGVPDDPGAKTLFLSTPIFFPMILFSLGALTATQSIVSDIPKDRMVLTPTNKFEMLFAKTAALQFIMSLLIIMTIIMSLNFGLIIRGSIVIFFSILFLIALSGVIWGLLVSALADVPLNALQYFIFLFLFQIIVLFFLQDPMILNWIPIHVGRKILMNVVLRGESPFIAANFLYIRYIVAEIIILYVATQIAFNRRKTML